MPTKHTLYSWLSWRGREPSPSVSCSVFLDNGTTAAVCAEQRRGAQKAKKKVSRLRIDTRCETECTLTKRTPGVQCSVLHTAFLLARMLALAAVSVDTPAQESKEGSGPKAVVLQCDTPICSLILYFLFLSSHAISLSVPHSLLDSDTRQSLSSIKRGTVKSVCPANQRQ